MGKNTKNQRKKCAKPTLYKTLRGDFMADMGDGRIMPIISVGVNEYEEGEENA